jgi:hypothetical protein
MFTAKSASRVSVISLVATAAAILCIQASIVRAAAADTSASSVDPSAAFADLNEAVGALQTNFGSAGKVGSSPVTIAQAAADLTGRWEKSGRRCSTVYAQTIEDDAQQIMAAIAQTDPAAASKILSEVNDDLSIKEAHAVAASKTSVSLGDDVAVTAKTERNGQDVTGYMVHCNDIRNAAYSNPDLTFNSSANSSAQATIAPGLYTCWAEAPQQTATVVGAPERIGTTGESSESIELSIP